MDLNGIDFSVVVDFIAGAIGFVILGIAVALVAARWGKGKGQQDRKKQSVKELLTIEEAEVSQEGESKGNGNNALIGVMFGIGMGICFGMSMDNWLFGLSIGFLWAIVMPMSLQNIQKENSKNPEKESKQEDVDISVENADKENTFQE